MTETIPWRKCDGVKLQIPGTQGNCRVLFRTSRLDVGARVAFYTIFRDNDTEERPMTIKDTYATGKTIEQSVLHRESELTPSRLRAC